MNIKDLDIFLAIAETENMQQAAEVCDATPSMLSKSLKRLEHKLGVSLFDRIGKRIKLNAVGVKFRSNASKLVAQAKLTMAECYSLENEARYTIAAPALLQVKWASKLSKALVTTQPK